MASYDLGDYDIVRPEDRTPVSVGDFARQNFQDAYRVSNSFANAANLEAAYDDINDRIKKATGQDMVNPLRADAPTGQRTGDGFSYTEALKALDPVAEWKRRVGDLRAKHGDAMPWDGIEDEPQRLAWDKMRAVREQTTAMTERAGLVSPEQMPYVRNIPVVRSVAALGANLMRNPALTAAQFGGGLAGQMLSAPDAAANLIGFGVGRQSMSLLKTSLLNAASNAAVQAPLSALKQADYKAAGLPYGFKAWLDEVEGAAGAGAVLDLAFRGPALAYKKARGVEGVGGILTDSPAKLDLPAAPAKREPISQELIDRASGNDIPALREIAEKTGAINDPAVKGILDHAELGGKVDEETVKFFEQSGIDTGEGLSTLARVLQNPDMFVRVPEPVRLADAPLLRDDGAAVMKDAGVNTALDGLPEGMRVQVTDLIEAGIPKVIEAVKSAIGKPETLALKLNDLAESMGGADKLADLATIHGMRGGPVRIAAAMRRSPELVDSNVSLDMDLMKGARALAVLDDRAFARVQAGEIAPAIGAVVADRVPPGLQSRVMDDLLKAGARSGAHAAEMIPDLMPRARPEMPLSGGGKIDDPAGAAAKAQTKMLEAELAPEIEAAMAPIKVRDAAEDQVFKASQEAKALEVAQDAELSRPAPEPKPADEPAPAPREPDLIDQGAALAEAAGLDGEQVRAVADQVRETVAPEKAKEAGPAFPATEALAAKRAELRAAEVQRIDAKAQVDGTPPDLLYRFILESAAMQRRMDVRRAIDDALRLANRILPEGTDVRIETGELRDSVSGHLLDATSDTTSGDIVLATYAMNPAARLGHEGVHTLVTKGHLAPAEVDLLATAARETGAFSPETEAKYRDAYKDRPNIERQIAEEAAAHFVEARFKGDTRAHTIADRVRATLQRVKNALAGYGFKTAEDVRDAVLRGDMAKREAVQAWMRSEDLTAVAVKPEFMAAIRSGENIKQSDIEPSAYGRGQGYARLSDGSSVYVKPRGNSKDVAALEVLANEIGRLVDPTMPRARMIEVDGNPAVALDLIKKATDAERGSAFADGVSRSTDWLDTEFNNLTIANQKTLVRQAAIDLYLMNEDAHGAQFLIGADGRVVGIDKEMAFSREYASDLQSGGVPRTARELFIGSPDRFIGQMVEAVKANRASGDGVLADEWNATVKKIGKIPRSAINRMVLEAQRAGGLDARDVEGIRAILLGGRGWLGGDRSMPLFAFAGERAKTADLEALATAKQMETDGKPREDIWTSTGWFKGVDGKWRFEIDDSGQKLRKTLDELDRSNPMPSDMVFSHDQLYSAYPQLGDVPWYRTPSMEGGGGSYDAARGIRVGSGEGLVSGKSGVGGITLHEQQHAVQGIEGFAQGGNRDVGHPRADVERMAREAYEANQAASKRQPTADDLLLAELGINPPDVSKPWDSLTLRQQMDWWEAGRGRAYHHLAGEAEARLVQKRMDLSADERRARPPWLDYDVPEDQQIVRGVRSEAEQAIASIPGSHFPKNTMFAIRTDEKTGKRYIEAYHGSPHSFDRFSSEAAGFLPGDHRYGVGHFFDSIEDGANYYRNRDSTPVRGHMYKVEINADPADFADLRAPLADQPKRVRDALRGIGGDKLDALPLGQTMRQDARLGVSEKLKAAGVPGAIYDNAGRDGYVVFDDSLITITHKDGKPVSAEERASVVDGMKPQVAREGQAMFAISDEDGSSQRRDSGAARQPDSMNQLRTPLQDDMSVIDRLGKLADLAMACRG